MVSVLLFLLLSPCFSQFFTPAPMWAAIPTAFPRFSATATTPLWGSIPIKQMSIWNPNPVPQDPTADQALNARLTSTTDLKIKNIKGNGQLNALYDQGSFRNFNMEITQDNIGIMKANPAQEVKVHCSVTVDFNTPEAKTFVGYGIGCGYKGSVGSLRICLDENHKSNGGCRKLSLRVDAEAFKTSKNQSNVKFYGARNLIFNGMPVDWSMMSERTAYNSLGDIGVIAPMASHAKLFLNGKFLGVYAFIQDVDAAFASTRFKDKGKGTLYKDLWFNKLHMKELATSNKKDDQFMKEVMSAIDSTPANVASATAFFNKYFDTTSLVDSTAFNTIIGNTDDWRQRHNFFWYVTKDDKTNIRKLIFVPWDYDRLYDEMAETRGPLKGKPWWLVQETTGGNICSSPTFDAHQMAVMMGGSQTMIAYNEGIQKEFPEDLNIPVTCDKMTQLMALALGSRVRAKTIELSSRVTVSKIRRNWATWNAQIQAAVAADPDGPASTMMLSEQEKLASHIQQATQKAVREASVEPLGSSYATPAGTQTSPSFGASSTSAFGASSFGSTSSFGTTSFQATPSFSFGGAASFPPAAPSFGSTISSPSFAGTSSFGTPLNTFSSFSSSPSFSSFPSFGSPMATSLPPFSVGAGLGVGFGR